MTILEPTHKLSIVVAKGIPTGVAMNAIAHLAAGITNMVSKVERLSDFLFLDFPCENGKVIFPSVSSCPFIILESSNRSKMVKAYEEATSSESKASGVVANLFSSTMRLGTIAEQVERTANANLDEVEYIAVAIFGPMEPVTKLSKRFRLYQ